MNSSYIFNDLELTVIPLDYFFYNIQLKFLNSITHNLPTSVNNNYIQLEKEVKQYFLHAIIFETCKYFQEDKSRNKILVVDPSFSNKDYELWNFINKDQVVGYILKTFKLLKKSLPMPIYVSDKIINFSNRTGEIEDILQILVDRKNDIRESVYNTKRLKKFTEDNGLLFLTNSYITTTDFKKLIYKT